MGCVPGGQPLKSMSHPNPFAIVLLSARAVTARPVTQLPLWEEAQLTQDGCKHRVTGESLREQGGTLHPSPPVPAVSQTTAQAKGGRPIFLCISSSGNGFQSEKANRGSRPARIVCFGADRRQRSRGRGNEPYEEQLRCALRPGCMGDMAYLAQSCCATGV